MESIAIVTDSPCVSCEYNLRGLAADGKCPECGHDVADSLRVLAEKPTEARWVKGLILGYVLLGLFLLVNLALQIFLMSQWGRTSKFQPHAIIYPEDVTRIAWPLLLIPVVACVRKPGSANVRSWWGARLLGVLVLAHLGLTLGIPGMRNNISTGWQTALFVSYGVEPFCLTAELFLLIGTMIVVSSRFPKEPMRREIMWFRRAFVLLLFVVDACQLPVQLSRIASLSRAGAMGAPNLSQPWRMFVWRVTSVAAIPLRVLWIYFLVLIVRFIFKLWGVLPWAHQAEKRSASRRG